MINKKHYEDSNITIYNDNCLNILKQLPDNSIDSIVTDPPAGISFMNKDWDSDFGGRDNWIKWMQEIATECLRVIKPGGHGLIWAIPRTSHWTTTAWENAGFEIRDVVAHIFGSGFPKSLNIGKAVDKLQGNDRDVVGKHTNPAHNKAGGNSLNMSIKGMPISSDITIGTSPWEGWGTALKPAREDWILVRKPISEKTIAQNVIKYGTGGINIDGCRIETDDKYNYPNGAGGNSFSVGKEPDGKRTKPVESNPLGRFPANLIHDGSDEVLEMFPNSKSAKDGVHKGSNGGLSVGLKMDKKEQAMEYGYSGSAARFFYCAKTSKSERNAGLDEFHLQKTNDGRNKEIDNAFQCGSTLRKNDHPTVKSIELMKYLCKLITPPNGIVLDPFMGSGSTGCACVIDGFRFIGIDLDEHYCDIAKNRINYYQVVGATVKSK